MRYSIDTIPVLDAFGKPTGCPFCTLYEKLETESLDHYMGDSKMEPGVRIAMNETGFCARHFARMYNDYEGRLGLALIVDTHTRHRMGRMQKNADALLGLCAREDGFFDRARSAQTLGAQLNELARQIRADDGSCMVCRRVDTHLRRYVETAVYLWEHEAGFDRLLREGDGLCLKHTADLLEVCAKGILSAKKRALIAQVLTMQQEKMTVELEDLGWFIRKFDYRNKEKPWGQAKTALPRVLNRLKGRILYSGSESSQ
ncbi:MAG: DUF6062 family protein [Eubacteriales bacterium]|nr:DUF6062 family protein [Eubacteriales bacterium]